jgi:hypothetical protein
MRTSLVLLTAALPLATVSLNAQTNRVLRNNEPWLVISAAAHPTTGVAFNYPPVNHPSFGNGVGVPMNASVWRVYPSATNFRSEPSNVDGFNILCRRSAASHGPGTTGAPGPATGDTYEPEMTLRSTIARTAAGQPAGSIDPDFTAGATIYAMIPEMPVPGSTVGTLFNISRSFGPASVSFSDCAVTMKYHGGEEDNRPAGAGTGVYSQCICASWQDGPTPWIFDGFHDPAVATNNGVTYKATNQFRSWMTYTTVNPTLSLFSDWGERRYQATNPLTPLLLGHSDGTYFSDLAVTASTRFGFSVRADTTVFSGGNALVLFNFQPMPFPTGFPILPGFVLNLNPGDPLLGLFTAISPPALGAVMGQANSVGVDFQIWGPSGIVGVFGPDPALSGQYFGFQAVAVNINPPMLTLGSTQATWVRFN